MNDLIKRLKKRIERGILERGYKSYQIHYKPTEFDFNFIPAWAMSEIRFYSTRYSDDSVYHYEIDKEVSVEFDQRFRYVNFSVSVKELKKKQKTVLDEFYNNTDLKLMINDTLDAELEFRFPYKYDKSEGQKVLDKLDKQIQKYLEENSGLEILNTTVNYQTDSTFEVLAYQIFDQEKKGQLNYVEQKAEVIPPLLPMAHYFFEFDRKKVIDTSDVDMKRILTNAIIHIEHQNSITFNVESSMSHYPKKDKQNASYHARQNSKHAICIIRDFMNNRGVDPKMYAFVELPLVQGPKYSRKYSKRFYNRFEYLNVLPTFTNVEDQEIRQTKYMVNYNSNSFTLDSNATMFKVFMEGIMNEINVYGYSKVILESSSSKAPTRTKMSSSTISYKRAEETRDIMKNYLRRKGIDPNRLILVEETCLIQGPEYNLDYFENKEKYKKYQYIKIIPHRLLSE